MIFSGEYKKAYPTAKLIAPEATIANHPNKELVFDGGLPMLFAMSFRLTIRIRSLGPRFTRDKIWIRRRCEPDTSVEILVFLNAVSSTLQIEHWWVATLHCIHIRLTLVDTVISQVSKIRTSPFCTNPQSHWSRLICSWISQEKSR